MGSQLSHVAITDEYVIQKFTSLFLPLRSIPSEIGALSAVEASCLLYSNRLSSSLPTEVGRMTALTTEFEAHANSLSASLPSELGALSGLKSWFRLDSNSFTGEVYTLAHTTASPIRHNFTTTTTHSPTHSSTPLSLV